MVIANILFHLVLQFLKEEFFFKEPKRGDVVVFKTPADNRTDYIKRLIGLPGDKIQFIDSNLYIKIILKLLNQKYLKMIKSFVEIKILMFLLLKKFYLMEKNIKQFI